jgi:hypothetical protein
MRTKQQCGSKLREEEGLVVLPQMILPSKKGLNSYKIFGETHA